LRSGWADAADETAGAASLAGASVPSHTPAATAAHKLTPPKPIMMIFINDSAMKKTRPQEAGSVTLSICQQPVSGIENSFH
jgi:hypothetical protein